MLEGILFMVALILTLANFYSWSQKTTQEMDGWMEKK